MLMLLIVVIAVGLMQLANISLRSTGTERDMAHARANARVALMLAIGQLQKEMGPDQRISVPAAMLDTNPDTPDPEGVANPHYTGVWSAAQPVTVANMDAPPVSRPQNFRNWLVSGDPAHPYNFATSTSLDGNPLARTMVGSGSVSNVKDEVKVPVINGPQSGFAWWTSDNGQKATVRASAKGTTTEPMDLATVLASSRRFNPDGYHAADADMPDGDPVLQKVLSLSTAAVAAGPKAPADQLARKYFHDLTTQSELLPVDVTTGKLKRCLNLRMAWLQDQTDAARVAEGTFGPPTGGAGKNYTLFSWDQLRSALSYTQDSNGLTFDPATGRPIVKASKQFGFVGSADEKEYNPHMGRERWRIAPVPIKMIYVVSCSTDIITNPTDPDKKYALRLNTYPIMVLWNPYNVDLVVPEYLVSAWIVGYQGGELPPAWKFKIDSMLSGVVDSRQFQFANFHSSFGREGPLSPLSNLVIPAGENRVLYPDKFDPARPGDNRGGGGYGSELQIWMRQKPFDIATGTPPNYGVPHM
ncbi:MAG TPA: hypothetical protein VF258_03245, partial [Luteolibacter sp.]